MKFEELLKELKDWKEDQGLDKHHWKRKEAFRAGLETMLKFKPKRRMLDSIGGITAFQMIEYLEADGEDVSRYKRWWRVYK